MFLLLLLEFVPGQDLFYFLEQARNPASGPPVIPTSPSPCLLLSPHPPQLLSHIRLRLIASMFAQMCEAVATCHDASVFHRDIKPDNFIILDEWTHNQDGNRERKVIVKLSDFGLSTRDAVSSDMDCGSAPYMSFGTNPIIHSLGLWLSHGWLISSPFTECRNNLAPVYKPRAADVWSLGIVLIKMYVTYCHASSSFLFIFFVSLLLGTRIVAHLYYHLQALSPQSLDGHGDGRMPFLPSVSLKSNQFFDAAICWYDFTCCQFSCQKRLMHPR